MNLGAVSRFDVGIYRGGSGNYLGCNSPEDLSVEHVGSRERFYCFSATSFESVQANSAMRRLLYTSGMTAAAYGD